MENNNKKFRLRLNLFDGIVLVLAIVVAGLLIWSRFKPQISAQDPSTTTMEYVVRFQRWPKGSSEMLRVGDKLVDNVKNLSLGTIKSFEAISATAEAFDQEGERFIRSQVPGYEDILVTVVSDTATVGEDMIQLDDGVQLRVGKSLYICGPGYMASGPVLSIERAEEVA